VIDSFLSLDVTIPPYDRAKAHLRNAHIRTRNLHGKIDYSHDRKDASHELFPCENAGIVSQRQSTISTIYAIRQGFLLGRSSALYLTYPKSKEFSTIEGRGVRIPILDETSRLTSG